MRVSQSAHSRAIQLLSDYQNINKRNFTGYNKEDFQRARVMFYADSEPIIVKAESLIKKLKGHIRHIKQDKKLFFDPGKTVYIPDLHGDFAHLIITLHRHCLLDKDLNLKKEHIYISWRLLQQRKRC